MSDIIELASQLGKAIATSAQAQKLRDARAGLNTQADLIKILQQYHEQSDKMAALEADNKVIEVADKHKLQEMHDKLAASETFKTFTSAQMEYVDLMRQVNAEMRKQLAQTEQ
jgi:cell fate (sporulation/competence/biofilm development) regulator YlbF (YheA/YmcA/DUF963 family)